MKCKTWYQIISSVTVVDRDISEEQKILRRCLDKIEDERELVHGARCLIQARKLARLKNIGFDETDVAFLQEK